MQPLLLRGHRYTFLGTHEGTPVYRAPQTDSMLRDRQQLSVPAILTVEQVRAPATSEGSWPGPLGNLYVSLPHDRSLEAARRWLSDGVGAWLARFAPGVACAESWEDGFGAHRVAGHFVTGMVVVDGAVGVDLHLGARYPEGTEHVSLSACCQASVGVDQALWALLHILV